MTVRSFAFNPFETNCYVCHEGTEAVIIDPSCHTDAEVQEVLAYVAQNDLQVRSLLLTHAHIDHIFGCAPLHRALDVPLLLHRALDVPLLLHRADEPLYAAALQQGRMFGIPIETPPPLGGYLVPGETIMVGEAVWEIRHTPGHSPGSVSFVDSAGGYVIAGDALFAGSIGRTDLWGGSLPTLLRAVEEQLMTLPDETVVYPGHYEATTIGRERRTNPYLTQGYSDL